MKLQDELLAVALELRAQGYPVVPIGKNKKTLVKWAPYQKQMPTEDEIRGWFSTFTEITGLALVTGRLSGLFVVDVDEEAMSEFPKKFIIPKETVAAKSGGGGYHVYFRYPNFKVKTQTGFSMAHVDIRGDGGYIVLPPSLHPNGKRYQWKNQLGKVPLTDAPAEILDLLKGKTRKSFDFDVDVPEGNRNDQAVKAIGTLLSSCHAVEEFETKAWPALLKWNKEHCKPPESEDVLRGKFDFYAKKEEQKYLLGEKGGRQPAKAKKLLDMALPQVRLFLDENEEPYAQFRQGDHYETYPCSHKNKRFSLWLKNLYYSNEENVVKSDDIKTVADHLAAIAYNARRDITLGNRVAGDVASSEFLLDLSDERWRMVRITPQGWDILE